MLIRHKHIGGAGSGLVAAANGGATLWSVSVNTAASASSIAVYDGMDNTGVLIATIDCSIPGSYWYGVLCNRGIAYVLTGTPDITIGFA